MLLKSEGSDVFDHMKNNWHLLRCCHDNSFAAGPVLIKTEISSIGLSQGPFTPATLMMRVRQYGNHVFFKQDLFPTLKG